MMDIDAGFTETMDDISELIKREEDRRERHLKRRLDLVSRLKKKKYMRQLRAMIRDLGVFDLAFVRNTGKGEKQENEYPAIKWEWVDQYENGGYSGDSFSGFVYLEIKPGRYLRLHYSM